MNRCSWCGMDQLYVKYHDEEWGVPIHDDRLLFEFLVLEGAQAGLSWITILRKRENYRRAFDNFDFKKIATYRKSKIQSLMKNEGIIRNRLKIESTILNAKKFMEIQKEFGSFDSYIWSFVGNKPMQHRRKTLDEIPASISISDVISRDLKKRGFAFVGSTIMYSFMQAVGMVNDHVRDCFRCAELS
jgi:DNA-3-methyladenine glycosylase I